jgi:hypothetical protein
MSGVEDHRSFYRRAFTLHHQELELRECDASSVYDMVRPRTKTQLESCLVHLLVRAFHVGRRVGAQSLDLEHACDR